MFTKKDNQINSAVSEILSNSQKRLQPYIKDMGGGAYVLARQLKRESNKCYIVLEPETWRFWMCCEDQGSHHYAWGITRYKGLGHSDHFNIRISG